MRMHVHFGHFCEGSQNGSRFAVARDNFTLFITTMKSNEQLRHDVLEALNWEPLLNGMESTKAEIGVAADNGVITLTGKVNSYPKKLAAERAAKSVQGIRAVAEELVIHLDKENTRSDTEIATAAINALKWCNSVPDKRITVKVEDGWVKLEGDVEWQFQKDEAQKEIEDLNGVQGVTNLITIRPQIKANDIQDKIKRALQRSATVDSSNVVVDVNGSLVTLRGTVRSWAEREDAENAAWAAPGVSKVTDELFVEEEAY